MDETPDISLAQRRAVRLCTLLSDFLTILAQTHDLDAAELFDEFENLLTRAGLSKLQLLATENDGIRQALAWLDQSSEDDGWAVTSETDSELRSGLVMLRAFSQWCARNAARDLMKREARRKGLLHRHASEMEATSSMESSEPLTLSAQAETSARLRDLVRDLDPESRMILRLCVVEQRTVREAAKTLSISASTLHRRLKSILELLRLAIADEID